MSDSVITEQPGRPYFFFEDVFQEYAQKLKRENGKQDEGVGWLRSTREGG